MNWIALQSDEQLRQIKEKSMQRPQVIFKHSTRCGTSAWAKNKLERSQPAEELDFYFLDVINSRQLSRTVAEEFHVHHESPQILIIRNGECIYDESHHGISMDDIRRHAA